MVVVLILIGLCVLGAFAALVFVTRGPFSVPLTVRDDPDLGRIKLADVTLHGRVRGPDGAPLVVALHGGPGADHRSLLGLEALSDTHRVVVFDQRGAGLSERVAPDDLGIASNLDDIDALIDRFASTSDVHLVGHSWGAMLAVAYLGYRPGRVSKAVLIEPGFLTADGYTDWEARRQRISRSPRVFWAGLKAGFAARNVEPKDHDAQRDFLVGSVVHAFANHPRNPYHCPGKPYSAPSWRFGGQASDAFWANPHPAIAQIEQGLGQPNPVLFIAGGCNDWTGVALQTDHAAMFPDSRVIEVPGAGHDVVWDQPDAALKAIRTFLQPQSLVS